MDSFDFSDALLEKITTNLKGFSAQKHYQDGYKHAAVAITIVNLQTGPEVYEINCSNDCSDHAAIILTRRASQLKNHAGQWALPGGQIDANESVEQAALRELEEEVGLQLSKNQIIGRLDDYPTRSGFIITPVVVWGGDNVCLTINTDEVASAHRIPVAEFMRKDAPILETIPESKHPVLMMPMGNSWIGAPTAAMIYQFREVAILGHHQRVAHFEQPVFAWQ